MEPLSKREEQILLAIGNLGANAYLVAIKRQLSEVTGRNLSIGAIHIPLRRLEREGIIDSDLGEATAVRGGRRKKIYRLTTRALEALRESKRVHDILWGNFTAYDFKKG
ncbi:MAG: PadR family transcriptional regulator [Candidatus Aminicenantes bacterium]|nr:MAG: PadR family transcriptional regulator [Candidatus Aminicenantes bacterium]